jgi:hypothetical protein
MRHRLKSFVIFGSVCLVIGLGASLEGKARPFDLMWISLLWSFMLAVAVTTAAKVWHLRKDPGGLVRLGDSRGTWLLPASLRRWLFDLP